MQLNSCLFRPLQQSGVLIGPLVGTFTLDLPNDGNCIWVSNFSTAGAWNIRFLYGNQDPNSAWGMYLSGVPSGYENIILPMESRPLGYASYKIGPGNVGVSLQVKSANNGSAPNNVNPALLMVTPGLI